jgi:guanylate kinase
VTGTRPDGSAVADVEPDERTDIGQRADRPVARMNPIAGDQLGEDVDDVIGDLRALRRPRVFIISGPSGVGKDAVIERLRDRFPDAFFAVTATTRNRRPGEIDGVHYYFLDEDDFRQRLAEGEFLESATVYGNHYGVLRAPLRAALARGQDVFAKVDVQGAAAIERLVPAAVSIFIAPESAATLLQRLRHRKTDDPAELMARFATARRELASASAFDYIVFNRQDQLPRTLDDIAAIVRAERCRIAQPEIHI